MRAKVKWPNLPFGNAELREHAINRMMLVLPECLTGLGPADALVSMLGLIAGTADACRMPRSEIHAMLDWIWGERDAGRAQMAAVTINSTRQ